MTVQDAPVLPALPDRARHPRWGYLSVRLLLVVLVLALAALLPAGRQSGGRLRYREGDIARERVVAPYDFRVEKDEAELRREQLQAAAAVPPVLVVDARVSAAMQQRLAVFQEKALEVALSADVKPADRVRAMRSLGVPLTEPSALALSAPGRARRVLRELGGWLNDLYAAGVVAEKRGETVLGYASINLRDGETETPRTASLLYDRREALALVAQRARVAFPDDPRSRQLVAELAGPFLQPNVVADRAETEWRRVQAQGAVPALLGFVKKDELLVDANQKMTREALGRLRSLENLEAARREPLDRFYPPLTRVLLMLLFIAAFMTYLRMELPGVYGDNAMLAMFALLTAVVLGGARFLAGTLGLPVMAVPLAAAPLVTASVLEKRPAIVFTLLLAVVTASLGDLRAPFTAMAVMGRDGGLLGGAPAPPLALRRGHAGHRPGQLVRHPDLAPGPAAPAGGAGPGPGLGRRQRRAVGGAGLRAAAGGRAPVRADLGHHAARVVGPQPAAAEAAAARGAGTYHHSMVVGSLAERAAEAIGANSLLARVSAYYHDIGKLAKPEYYNENIPPHVRNPHEKLTPNMSTLVVRSHLGEGLELARREHLPRAVRAAIPEHHGTMVMAYFYAKALESDPGARREDFSYPGPRPRSKETAILMLADGVEGASRALSEPTPSRIRGLVTRNLEERVQQGQLDECGLTLQELARIREAFIPVLTATFHVRVKYPEVPRPNDARLRR